MQITLYSKFILILAFSFLYSSQGFADNEFRTKRAALADRIADKFPEQLTDPQKINRKSKSQFGYGLSLFRLRLYRFSEFIDPANFGQHSYGKPSTKERNGVIYTCRGGFIDFSHMRASADWSVYLIFKMVHDNADFDLPDKDGKLSLHFKNLDDLSLNDIASLGQKIAFERLVWHEISSWYHHPPNFILSEQQSAFSPEDIYSDFLGTQVGKNIALRILNNSEDLSYSEIASEEIRKAVTDLLPMGTKDKSKKAYDIVDRHKQRLLPRAKKNKDIWWDSHIVFLDQRYVFKRYLDVGPKLSPWLVPKAKKIICPADSKSQVLSVPQNTKAGVSLNNYYEFQIIPDTTLFYDKRNAKEIHPPLQPFVSKDLEKIISFVKKDMEKSLLPGFDKRNSVDPVPSFGKVKGAEF
ncbi:MAG: DUF4056 domain-containing protein [Bacteroidota bacterium]